jgi:hypothetical protein
MHADFLSRNAIGAVGIFSDNWKLKQEQVELCQPIKTTYILTNKPVYASIL